MPRNLGDVNAQAGIYAGGGGRETQRERGRERWGIANDVPLFHSSHEETDFMLTCALESTLGLKWRAN